MVSWCLPFWLYIINTVLYLLSQWVTFPNKMYSCVTLSVTGCTNIFSEVGVLNSFCETGEFVYFYVISAQRICFAVVYGYHWKMIMINIANLHRKAMSESTLVSESLTQMQAQIEGEQARAPAPGGKFKCGTPTVTNY